jgi:hypothetical protein
MRRISTAILAVVVAHAAASCDETTCDPCPVNEDTGESLCLKWEGAYHGEMIGRGGSCGESTGGAELLEGSIRIDVYGIGPGPEGEATVVTMDMTDSHGNWTTFEGFICDTQDEEPPYSYTFDVFYEETDQQQMFRVNNVLSGLLVEDEAGNPYRLDATYSVAFTDSQNSENSCRMRADVTTER